MKFAILDASFSLNKQEGRGMSARYLKWELDKRRINEYPAKEANILLVSCQSTEAVPFLESLRKKYPSKKIICGGSASTSPYSLGKFCDAVCVGDGQSFLDTLFSKGFDVVKKCPNAWIDGEIREVEIDYSFPWDMPPIQAEDGAFRVWCGRGCKKKCGFCQTGWAYRYFQNPNPDDVINQAYSIINRGLKVAYLSNDVMQHSFAKRLPPTMHGSYSIDFLKKAQYLPPARQIRLGVEGVSERLRRFVSKPIGGDDLLKCTIWLNQNHKSVRWFVIAGIPGEKQADWNELKEIVQKWKAHTNRGVLALSFTAFCPDPATPLSIEPINDDYWLYFKDFSDWFFDGRGWSNRVKILRPQSPTSRMIKAVRSMGLPEEKLREGGNFSPNWLRLNYPYKTKIEDKMIARSKSIKDDQFLRSNHIDIQL